MCAKGTTLKSDTFGQYALFSTFMMIESRKSTSPWKVLLDVYPEVTKNFPIFFGAEDKAWLKGSSFLPLLEAKVLQFKGEYDLIVADIPDYKMFTFREYCEKRAMAESRCFQMHINGDLTTALVSYSDMLNHANDPCIKYGYNDSLGGFEMILTRDMKKGQEVTGFYGLKPNTMFFGSYGFCLDVNGEHDDYTFLIKLKDIAAQLGQETHTEIKVDMLDGKSTEREFSIRGDFTYANVLGFFSWLRFCSYDGDM